MNTQETICALSTPPGAGGIAVIRLSGPQSLAIAQVIFRKKKGPSIVSEFPSHTVHFGNIIHPETGDLLDEGLLLVFRAPRSYTCEEMVEIQCHGGQVPVRRTLEAILNLGGRMAKPGEFTQRAFLNGRIDLAQAEGVIDLINASSDREMEAALSQLQGDLSREILEIQGKIVSIVASLEALLDFPDEEITFEPSQGRDPLQGGEGRGDSRVPEMTIRAIEALRDRLDLLVRSYADGKVLKEGIKTAIVGRPNVGKSTLLNRFLGEDRAIVTPFPGTTRDLLEEKIVLEGVPLRILDMAGIRETHDPVEQEGIQRARKALHEAELVLIVLDAGDSLRPEDHELLGSTRKRNRILILNKVDRERKVDLAGVQGEPVFLISALNGTGLAELKRGIGDYIGKAVWSDRERGSSPVVLRVRHQEVLKRAREHLSEFLKANRSQAPLDILSIHLHGAVDSLGEIVGTVTTDEILNRIFSEFCIGK